MRTLPAIIAAATMLSSACQQTYTAVREGPNAQDATLVAVVHLSAPHETTIFAYDTDHDPSTIEEALVLDYQTLQHEPSDALLERTPPTQWRYLVAPGHQPVLYRIPNPTTMTASQQAALSALTGFPKR